MMKPWPSKLNTLSLAMISLLFYLLLLISSTTSYSRRTVVFPTDEELKVHLPEWQPKERGIRSPLRRSQADNKHFKIKSYKSGQGSRHKCPEYSRVQPCNCKEKGAGLDITCENLSVEQLRTVTSNIKEHTEGSGSKISYFKVRNSRLGLLPDYIFMGLKIAHLIFFDCGLYKLMPNSLSSLAETLKHLVLSNNDLNTVPTMAFRQLRELDHVNLNQNNISVIENGAFWGLSKVTRLTLYDNKIHTIHPDAFDGLTKWTGTPVKGLNQSYLCHDTEEYENENNYQLCSDDDVAQSPGDLLRLNVGRNHLSEIPREALLPLKNLNQLDLSFNQVRRIEANIFVGMEKLDTLTMNHNKIDQLGAKYFEGLPKVTSLSLDYNKIKQIHADAFSGLEEQLLSLSLAANKIDEFPCLALRPLHQLNTLHLNDNNITRLDEGCFEDFGDHIQNLWLQNNKISEIPENTFDDLTTLEWLKLNNNRLKSIPYELIEPVLDTIKHIDIYENPLECDCEMHWYKKWWMGEWQRVDTDHIKDITCRDPKSNEVHLMKDVNLSAMYCLKEAPPKLETSDARTEFIFSKCFLTLSLLLLKY